MNSTDKIKPDDLIARPVRYVQETGRILDENDVIIVDYNIYGEDDVIDRLARRLVSIINREARLVSELDRKTRALENLITEFEHYRILSDPDEAEVAKIIQEARDAIKSRD